MEKRMIIFLNEIELKDLVKQAVGDVLKHNLANEESSQNEEEPKLMKVNEVAELLGVTALTVHNYKRKQLIPFLKIGRSLYFEREKVLQAMREFRPRINYGE